MSGFSTVFTLLLTALVLENAVLSRAMDATTLLAVPFGRKGAWLFGGILTGVTTLSAALACLLSGLIGKLPAIAYLRPVAYLLLMILLYALTCLALFWKQKSWLDSNFSMLNLAFFNTAVYGAMSLAVYSGLNGWQGAIYGFGVGVSYLLAVVILEQGRRAMAVCNIPPSFRGLPAELVYVGVIALSLYGLVGHQLAA